MEGSTNTGADASGSAPAPAPSTTTAPTGESGGATKADSPSAPTREGARRGTREAMRETFERAERAKALRGGSSGDEAPRDPVTKRFVPRSEQAEAPSADAPVVDEKTAVRPKPEAGEPSKEGEGKPDDDRIPKAAFQERIARERKRQEALTQKLEGAELKAAKAEEAFRIMAAKAEALEKALREGKTFDPRDDALSRYELAEEARKAAERVDADFASRRQKAIEEQQTIEARENARAEINKALAKYPLAAFQEVVDAMVQDPDADLEAVVKRIHDGREAQGWMRKPTEPPPAAAPALSRATSSGPSASVPVGHGRDALMATWLREEAKRKTMGR